MTKYWLSKTKLPSSQSDKLFSDYFGKFFQDKTQKICTYCGQCPCSVWPALFMPFSPVTEDKVKNIITSYPTKL